MSVSEVAVAKLTDQDENQSLYYERIRPDALLYSGFDLVSVDDY